MNTTRSLPFFALCAILSVSLTASCSSDKKPSQKAPSIVAANSQPIATPSSTTSNANKPDMGRVSATEIQEKILCPEVAELSKKGLFWGAPRGWRSYSQSFVNEVFAFVEAQWHGVNVGKMMCVYVSKQKRSFPVVLQNDVLTKQPTGYRWGEYKEGMVKCKSSNINDCPFFHTKRDVDMEQVYDELKYKGPEDDLN